MSEELKPIYNGPQSKFHDDFWRNIYERLGDKAISATDQVSVGRAISVAINQNRPLSLLPLDEKELSILALDYFAKGNPKVLDYIQAICSRFGRPRVEVTADEVRKWWRFDDMQQPLSTYHEREEFIKKFTTHS